MLNYNFHNFSISSDKCWYRVCIYMSTTATRRELVGAPEKSKYGEVKTHVEISHTQYLLPSLEYLW